MDELSEKILMIGMYPRFAEISDYFYLTRRKAINNIKSKIIEENKVKVNFTNFISEFDQSKDNNELC